MRLGVVHGPNLNLLGQREPEWYGDVTLARIDTLLDGLAKELGIELETFQSNGEGELIDHIQGAAARIDGYLVNAGAYTHTSVALRDALVGVGRPFVEVHLTNVHAREAFRRRSLLSSAAIGVVTGFGAESYLLGLRGLAAHLRRTG